MPNAMVIDISHHQKIVDFKKARAAGVVGVVHKATQGTHFVDGKYAARKKAALQAGLLWGAYHFGTGNDVDRQVSHFLQATKPDSTFLLVLDFEKNEQKPENSMSLAQARAFLNELEKRSGQHPTIYTGHYMYDVAGNKPDAKLAQYRVWWARYGEISKPQPTWPDYWLWQYTDGHHGPKPRHVDGIGYCDCDHFDGSEADLRASWLA